MEFMTSLTKKDEECRDLAGLIGDMERKMKKALTSSKVNAKSKQELKLKERDLFAARKELRNARD